MTYLEQAARAEAEPTLGDRLADVVAQFAVETNPRSLSVGIDSAYELGDRLASWLAEYLLSDGNVEKAARILHQEFCLTRIYEGEGDEERIVGITPWDWLSDESRKRYETAARAALRAVLSEGESS